MAAGSPNRESILLRRRRSRRSHDAELRDSPVGAVSGGAGVCLLRQPHEPAAPDACKAPKQIEDARIAPPPQRPVHPNPTRRFKSVAAGEGSEILISFFPIAWVPERVSWLARMTEFKWNSHFCDAQVRGPFRRFRHRHWIVAEVRDGVEGTLGSDDVEFELPLGFPGRIGGVFVRRELTRSFAYRQKLLPEILAAAAAARQAVKRR